MGIPLRLAASGRHADPPSSLDSCHTCAAGDPCVWHDFEDQAAEVEARPALAGTLADRPAGGDDGAAEEPQAVRSCPRNRFAGPVRIPGVARGKPELRRAVPIHAVVGPNGSGKGVCVARDTIPSLDAGRLVLSTVRWQDFRGRRPCEDPGCRSPRHGQPGHLAAHPAYEPLTDFRQLMDAEHCDVILDEVTGVADARESGGMPVQIRNLLVQLRRRDVVLRWTSPSFMFADVTIRRVTQAVTFSRGMAPVEVEGSLWRSRRAFLWRTFDAREIPLDEQRVDASVTLREAGIRPVVRELFWRPGSLEELAYDTSDSVSTLGVANQAGMCMTCAGKRVIPRCTCD